MRSPCTLLILAPSFCPAAFSFSTTCKHGSIHQDSARPRSANAFADESDGDKLEPPLARPMSRSSFLALSTASLLAVSIADPCTAAPSSSTLARQNLNFDYVGSSSSTILSQVSQKRDKKKEETLEETISGFISGAALTVTKTVVKFPLDTAAVRLQMPRTTYSIFDLPTLFDGSYRGISAPLLSNIPGGAVFFAVKDSAKAIFKDQGMPKWSSTSLAVLLAQPLYWLIRNPSEVVKTRQQAGIDGYGEGVSVIDGFKLAMAKDSESSSSSYSGIGELYAGYFENILYAYPADVIKFLCYESLSGGRKDLPPLKGAVYGAASTAVAQFITTPLDVVRNRIMAGEQSITRDADEGGRSTVSKSSYLESLSTLAREEGLEGLFAGASPRVGKAILSGAIQFATYEETKQSINSFLERNFFKGDS